MWKWLQDLVLPAPRPARVEPDPEPAVAPSPSVELVAIAAGHTQLQDQDHCVGCAACSPYGTADDDTVLAYSVRYLTAFFARELLGDASVGAGLDGAGVALDVAQGRVTRSTR